jgi:YqaJ-like viral recombinase domain
MELFVEMTFSFLFSASPDSAIAKLANCSRVQNLPPAHPSQPTDDRYLSTVDFLELIEREVNCIADSEPVFENDDLREFYNTSVKMNRTKSTEIQSSSQSSKIWRNERKLRITASVCYQIFTYSRNKNPDWGKKITSIHRNINTESILYGKNTEQLAFERYKKDEPNVKQTGLCVNPKLSWLGCSPDGVIMSKNKILEIKCPKAFETQPVELKGLKFLCHEIEPNGSSQYSLRKKHGYYGQVQLNMHLLNCDSADFVIYSKSDDEYKCINVNYDKEFVSNMINSLKKVYFEIFLPHIYQKSLH